MPRKKRKADEGNAPPYVCPCCGNLSTPGEDYLEAVYEYRRRQVGGRVSWEIRRAAIPEGYESIRDAARRMHSTEAKLRAMARGGLLEGATKHGSAWIVPKGK